MYAALEFAVIAWMLSAVRACDCALLVSDDGRWYSRAHCCQHEHERDIIACTHHLPSDAHTDPAVPGHRQSD
jgi:hypothetical protein